MHATDLITASQVVSNVPMTVFALHFIQLLEGGFGGGVRGSGVGLRTGSSVSSLKPSTNVPACVDLQRCAKKVRMLGKAESVMLRVLEVATMLIS